MAEAKTAIKRGGINPGRDVKARYLAGSTYTSRVLRNRHGSGGVKKKGKTKLQRLATPVAIDKNGYTVGGWTQTTEV